MSYYNIVRRNSSDDNPIFFEWDSSSATISVQKSLNGSSFVAAIGTATYQRSEGDSHLYAISYNAADRPSDGTAEYKLSDGSTVRIIPLAIDVSSGGSGGGGNADTDDIVAGVLTGLNNAVVSSSPTSTEGQIPEPIVIGDDYLAANNRAFTWTVNEITGLTAAGVSTSFGIAHPTKGSFTVSGSVADNGDGTWLLSFDVPSTATAQCREGEYEWSVSINDASGNHITKVRNNGDCYRVKLIELP